MSIKLTNRQQQVYDKLPADVEDVADELGISASTVHDHIGALRRKGYPIVVRDGYAEEAEQPKPPRIERRATPDEKNEVFNAVKEMQEWLADDLSRSAPAVADGGLVMEDSHEDVVIHRTDDHLGATRTDWRGEEIYNTPIGLDRVGQITDNTMEVINRQQRAGYVFDTAHLLLGGDIVDGQGIFPGQPYEQDRTLLEMVEDASDLYMEQIERLSREFETVQVIAQKGNHGELRGREYSDDANIDCLIYMTLDKRIRDRGLTNVTFVRNHASYYTYFQMRGHDALLRHGQKSLKHIGTSSGENRWRGWLYNRPEPGNHIDIAYRGHYHFQHMIRFDGHIPILMPGSICPPGDFEEGMAITGVPGAMVHGISDSRPLTWNFSIDFE